VSTNPLTLGVKDPVSLLTLVLTDSLTQNIIRWFYLIQKLIFVHLRLLSTISYC